MRNCKVTLACFALAIIATFVLPSVASAQPLARTDHDWTINVVGKLYGIDRLTVEPGHWVQTRIWVADHLFHPETDASDRIVFLFPGAKLLYISHTYWRLTLDGADA